MCKRSKSCKTPFLGGLLVAGLMAVGTVVQCAAVVESVSESGASVRQYSAGIADVVRMVDARVDAEVIKAYIQNSTIAYHPGATEIIALKDHGVSTDILTALLLRGSELKAQERRASPAGQPSSPVAPNPYATVPGYDYGAQPAYQDYPYYPAYSYSYPNYGYNYGYDYGYSWPYFGSAFYLSFDPYCRFRHHGFRSFGHEGHFAGIHPHASPGRFGGFGSFAGSGRATSFAGHSGGFGGFNSGGHSVSVPSHGGGFHSGGGSAGHSHR